MGIARNLFKTAARGVYTRLMDRVGSKVVAGIADTSSDAPDAFYQPKRDVYRQMVEDERARKKAAP
jgi:hypothetical protein